MSKIHVCKCVICSPAGTYDYCQFESRLLVGGKLAKAAVIIGTLLAIEAVITLLTIK
jgi:hypothetical protein